jgi:hypothetical protein
MNTEETGVETTEEETSAQTAPTEETTTEDKVEADDSKPTPEAKAEETSEEIDYKAELERSKRQLKKAEHRIVELKKGEKETPKDEDPWADEEPAVDPKKLVEEEVSKFKAEFISDAVDEAIDSLTKNPDERKLIEFIYENRLVKTGYSRKAVQADIEAAHLLANSKRFMTENAELKRTIATKKTITNSGSGSNQDKPESEPGWTDADKALFAGFGVDPNKNYRKVRK